MIPLSARVACGILLASLVLFPLGGQSGSTAGQDEILIREDLLIQDIRTGSFLDLAIWIQSLGLEPSGNHEQLQSQLYEYYGLGSPSFPQSSPEIEIQSAESLGLSQPESSGPRRLLLSGGVSIIFHDSETDSIHRIFAEQIILDEESDVLSASGSVRYLLRSGDREELFEGSQLYFDVNDWSGIFIQGSSVRLAEGDSPDFRYTGTTIVRSSGDLIQLRQGIITSSVWDPPAYTIQAGEILVYAPGEWSISGGILRVGNIPVFVLPAFFNPVEEVFFHPSTGTHSRRGEFIQTSTYLLGRASEPEALFDFLRFEDEGEDYEKEIRGIFLRDTDRILNSSERLEDSLRIYGDYYSRLGFHFGLEGIFQNLGNFRTLHFYAGAAFTRNLYRIDGYSEQIPFYLDPDKGEYHSVRNQPLIGGIRFPFRFGLDLKLNLNLTDFSLNLQLPFSTDRQYFQDLSDRKEAMPWAQIIGIASEDSSRRGSSILASAQNQRQSHVWQLEARGTIRTPGLEPYLSGITISRFRSDLTWRNVDIAQASLDPAIQVIRSTSPDANTYLLEQFRPVQLLVDLRGSLFNLERYLTQQGQAASPSRQNIGEAEPEEGRNETEPELFPEPRSPWEELESTPPTAGDPRTPIPGTDSSPAEASGEAPDLYPAPILPSLLPRQSATSSSSASGNIELSYDINNSFELGLRNQVQTSSYNPADPLEREYWSRGEDLRLNLRINSSLPNQILQFNNTLSLQFRDSAIFDWNPEMPDSERESRLRNIMSQNQLRLSQITALVLNPFRHIEQISGSKLSYNITPIWYLRKFTDIDNEFRPEYLEQGFRWEDASLQTHSLAATLAFKENDFDSSLTLNAVLPPKTESYQASFSMGYKGVGMFNASTGLTRRSEDLEWNAVNLGIKLEPLDWLSLSSAFRLNLEEVRAERLNSELILGPMKASLLFDHGKRQEFDTASGWKETGEATFIPSRFSLSLKDSLKPEPFWKNRIKLEFDYGLNYQQGLQRVTDSVLTVDLGLKLAIFEFLDLSFTSRSSNTRMYSYMPFLLERINPGLRARNILEDLVRSFNFFNPQDRLDSNFNLDSLSFQLDHDLGDWLLEIDYSLKPVLNDTRDQYKWDSLFSFAVSWKPIPEIQRKGSLDEDGIISFED